MARVVGPENHGRADGSEDPARLTIQRLEARVRALEALVVRLRREAAERVVANRLQLLEREKASRELKRAIDELSPLRERVRELEQQVEEQHQRVRDGEAALRQAEADSAGWRALYDAVARSRSYRLMAPFRLLYASIHAGTGGLRVFTAGIRSATVAAARAVLPPRVRSALRYLLQRPAFHLPPNPDQRIHVYARDSSLLPHVDRVIGSARPVQRRSVSLIATVKDEGATIERWLPSIANQRRLPDEVVVVDGGSSDDTVEKLELFGARSPFPLRVIRAPGVNVAVGRNLAIKHAASDVIAITDAGSELHPDWLDLITIPFDLDPATDVVAGFYTAAPGTPFQRLLARFLVPSLEGIDPETFSPSSRSLALTKALWGKIGGYPEYLTLSGEDTLFNVNAKRQAAVWAFVPEALVFWHPPATLGRVYRTLFSWGRGDAEARLFPQHYLKLGACYAAAGLLLASAVPVLFLWPRLGAVLSVAALMPWLYVLREFGVWRRIDGGWRPKVWSILVLSTIHLGQITGYLRGRRNRRTVLRRRAASIAGNVLILAGIPIYDTGGGQRSSQLALELLEQGALVTHVNRFPSYETRPVQVSYAHHMLATIPYEQFNIKEYMAAHEAVMDRTCVLVEFPLPEYEEIAAAMRQRGAFVIYDLMDDWDSALGRTWYKREAEDRIIAGSDLLVATAQDLKDDLERRAPGRVVLLLPNAVNSRLFDRSRVNRRPADLPSGRPVIGYVGSMYGEWFREDLMTRVALQYPHTAVVVVGDHRTRFAQRPPNLHTLGLKPHIHIPDYVAHFDICVIPFDPVQVIQATSPLKVFEYLAMGKPVVSTPMRELRGVPNVRIASTDDDFVTAVGQCLETPAGDDEGARAVAFANHHSWTQRAETLLEAVHWVRESRASRLERSAPLDLGLPRVLGRPMRHVCIDKVDFLNFRTLYVDPRPGIDDEKLLEYYIGFRWLQLDADDVFIDVAAQDSPFAFFVRDRIGCRVYRQDLYYMQPGIHGDDIGGDAAHLPLPPGSVTKMALFNSFEHFEGDSDVGLIIEAQRVLRPGGRLVIVPLYVGLDYAIDTKSGWTDAQGVKHLWGVGARFSRVYDAVQFATRILRQCRDFHVEIYAVDNACEISPAVHLQYFAVLEGR